MRINNLTVERGMYDDGPIIIANFPDSVAHSNIMFKTRKPNLIEFGEFPSSFTHGTFNVGSWAYSKQTIDTQSHLSMPYKYAL